MSTSEFSTGGADPIGEAPRLAYLLSTYPAVSHTFLLNEILELQKLGFIIDVASINRPTAWEHDSQEVLSALDTTCYIKQAKLPRIGLALLKTVFCRPLVVFRGAIAAFRLDGWNLPRTGYALFYLLEALILGEWLRKRGHKHLHIHFGGPVATVGMLASIAWKIPYSLTLHGPDEFYDVDRFHVREKVERSLFVLCISDYCRSQVMKIVDPAHWSKLLVSRLGVDTKLFAPHRSSSRNCEVELLCIGRLVPAKGQLILLHAFSNLLQQGYKARLRFIGDGADRSQLEGFVVAEGIAHSVIFEGALDHDSTRKHLSSADIFVLASFAEGLPVALMEAMAMEVPCISTFVAGIPELIRNGVDGLLVPPSSIPDLTAALARLIIDEAFRRELGTSGRRRVQDLYGLRRNVSLLAETLRWQLYGLSSANCQIADVEVAARDTRDSNHKCVIN